MRDATRQIMVLQCQFGQQKARFDPADRALPAAVLHRLPRDVLYRVRLLVRSETVLRWHCNLIAHRHAVDEHVGRRDDASGLPMPRNKDESFKATYGLPDPERILGALQGLESA